MTTAPNKKKGSTGPAPRELTNEELVRFIGYCKPNETLPKDLQGPNPMDSMIRVMAKELADLRYEYNYAHAIER